MAKPTFYWHDYETWGADPMRDRPSQFAGVRTDWELNVVGEPLMLYCQPPRDMLPAPEACLITGITPQKALAEGVPEHEFVRRVHDELARPGTCGVGYNSIRFDDEITRFTLYRNFYDAYGREWQNGNSRWDLIDVVRLVYAVRPEALRWPTSEEGLPSFRLEELSKANGLVHEAAHDALSDVHATIALARRIRQHQPRLFDYALELRKKQAVAEQLNIISQKPVLHISAMYPAARGCAAVVMPLAYHPTNKNGVIVYDLSVDPAPLLGLDAEQLRQRLFVRTEELAEGQERVPLKVIHLNRCPMVATTKLLEGGIAERLGIDLARARQHFDQIRAAASVMTKLQAVFSRDYDEVAEEPEVQLYSGGFFSERDKKMMTDVRLADAETLAREAFPFADQRLVEMLFHYRGRNFPDSLSQDEATRWQEYRRERLYQGWGGVVPTVVGFEQRLAELRYTYQADPRSLAILGQLQRWLQDLLSDLGTS